MEYNDYKELLKKKDTSKMTRKISIRENITVIVLTLVMTFMEMTALPADLICDLKVKVINPIYFSLMINFLIAFLICWLCRRFLIKEWTFGMHI